MSKIITLANVNLVAPTSAAKHELLFNKAALANHKTKVLITQTLVPTYNLVPELNTVEPPKLITILLLFLPLGNVCRVIG